MTEKETRLFQRKYQEVVGKKGPDQASQYATAVVLRHHYRHFLRRPYRLPYLNDSCTISREDVESVPELCPEALQELQATCAHLAQSFLLGVKATADAYYDGCEEKLTEAYKSIPESLRVRAEILTAYENNSLHMAVAAREGGKDSAHYNLAQELSSGLIKKDLAFFALLLSAKRCMVYERLVRIYHIKMGLDKV